MKSNITRWRQIGAFLVTSFTLSALLAACGSSRSGTPLGTVSVTGFPTSTYLPFWVIEAKHFDTKYGFKLNYINTSGGAALYPPVASGHADASTILPPLAIEYAAQGAVSPTSPLVPVPAFWVRATPSHPGTAIVARTGINRLNDLRGKIIATHDVVSGFFIQAETVLAEHGLAVNAGSSNSLRTDTMPFSAMGAALSRNIIQAALMDYITALQTASLGEGHILTTVLGSSPYTNYDEDTFVFNRQFLQTRGRAAIALLRATLQANYWILHHKSQARAILLAQLGISLSAASRWIGKYNFDGFQTNFVIPLKQSTVQSDASALLRWGIIMHRININSVYQYAQLVQTAQKGWIPLKG